MDVACWPEASVRCLAVICPKSGLCHEDVETSCCVTDEGRPFGAALWEEAPNSHELLRLKAAVVNVMEKARGRLRHVRMRETNASEPLLKHRNRIRWHQNQGLSDALGSAWRQPTYWPCGVRCAGGVTLILALTWNVRTCSAMPREKVQAATTARPKVPMRRAGADRLVVAMKRV